MVGWLFAAHGTASRRLVLTALAAATIMLLGNGPIGAPRAETLSQDEVSAIWINENPELYGLMQEEFPDDYAGITGKMTELLNADASWETVQGQAVKMMTKFRRKYSPYVGQASDADHTMVLESSIRFHQALLAFDPVLCNKVALDGALALSDAPGTEELRSLVDEQVILIMRAAVTGMKSPVDRRTITEDDWVAVDEAMIANGATEAEVRATIDLPEDSPDLCPGLIKFMQTLNAVDTEQVKAVRAEYLLNLAAI